MPPAPAAASRVIGIVALALALVTLIVPTAIALGTMPLIGGAAAPAFWYDPPIWSWDHLTPVKGEVLATEIAFWAGTVVGCVSIALGVVAIARRRGRGFGIAAVVVGVLAFFVFMVAGFFAFTFGMTFAY